MKKCIGFKKQFRIGYFGEIKNTHLYSELSSNIDLIHIDTSNCLNTEWMDIIGNYPAFYCIRKYHKSDGFKPFLKGFIAAYYSANVLAYKGDIDTNYYLTKDYPYLLENSSLEAIASGLSLMKESYLSEQWFFALEIMKSVREKSSDEFIISEVKELFKKLGLKT